MLNAINCARINEDLEVIKSTADQFQPLSNRFHLYLITIKYLKRLQIEVERKIMYLQMDQLKYYNRRCYESNTGASWMLCIQSVISGNIVRHSSFILYKNRDEDKRQSNTQANGLKP